MSFRDASGNVLAIYKNEEIQETIIYGSSRLGQYRQKDNEKPTALGQRIYEFSNHLGNVLVTLSDNKVPQTDGTYKSVVVSASDYYPFGLAMSERTYSNDNYRYGFNGKENDAEFGSHIQDYGARLYDKKLGRWFACDPLEKKYPSISTYVFVTNTPLQAIDPDGERIKLVGSRKNKRIYRSYLRVIKKSEIGRKIIKKMKKSSHTHTVHLLDFSKHERYSKRLEKKLNKGKISEVEYDEITGATARPFTLSKSSAKNLLIIEEMKENRYKNNYPKPNPDDFLEYIDFSDSDGTGSGSDQYFVFDRDKRNYDFSTVIHEWIHSFMIDRGMEDKGEQSLGLGVIPSPETNNESIVQDITIMILVEISPFPYSRYNSRDLLGEGEQFYNRNTNSHEYSHTKNEKHAEKTGKILDKIRE